MCGRFSLTLEPEEIATYVKEEYEIVSPKSIDSYPRYNIAPGQQVLSIIYDGTAFRIGELKWGLVPPFAKDDNIGYQMINARCETMLEKPSFKTAVKNKRCLILADGFYEWKKDGASKIPYRVTVEDQDVFAFAGLYSGFKQENGDILYTCTIITREANQFMKEIHTRMPIILHKDDAKKWLESTEIEGHLDKLLQPYEDNLMKKYEITSLVNSWKNETPDVLKPAQSNSLF